MKPKIACLLLALSVALSAVAQQSRTLSVSGRITDPQQQPVPGVTVQIKGTTQGIIADADGRYSITVPSEGSVLIFSCLGYETQDVTVAGRAVINVIMPEEASQLEETVVIAYGQQRKESVVAAISSIPATGLKQTPASNLGIALAGRLPGLTVLQRSGVPGFRGEFGGCGSGPCCLRLSLRHGCSSRGRDQVGGLRRAAGPASGRQYPRIGLVPPVCERGLPEADETGMGS